MVTPPNGGGVPVNNPGEVEEDEDEDEDGVEWLSVVVGVPDPIPLFSSTCSDDSSIFDDGNSDMAHFVSSLLSSTIPPSPTATATTVTVTCSDSRLTASSDFSWCSCGLAAAGTTCRIFSNNGVAPSCENTTIFFTP